MNYPLKKMVAHKSSPKNSNKNGGADNGFNYLVRSIEELKHRIEIEQPFIGDDGVRKLIDGVDMALLQARGAERKIHSQQKTIAEMERLALNDCLTNALNRRGIEAELRRVLSAAGRYNETGILVFIDLDGFKPINDTYGHGAGDLVLQKVVELLKANVRPHDSVGRLGGDEFAVILSRTDWKNGIVRAEMLERVINNTIVHWNRAPIAVRASFGFERFGSKTDAIELMSMADEAMYRSKRIRAEQAQKLLEETTRQTTQTPMISEKLWRIFKGEISA